MKPKHLGHKAKTFRSSSILRPKYLGQSQRSISNMKPKILNRYTGQFPEFE